MTLVALPGCYGGGLEATGPTGEDESGSVGLDDGFEGVTGSADGADGMGDGSVSDMGGEPSVDCLEVVAPTVPTLDPDEPMFSFAHWSILSTRVLLDREPTGSEVDAGVLAMQSGQSPAEAFADILASVPPDTAQRGAFIERVFEQVLDRTPSAQEREEALCYLTEADGTASPDALESRTWWEFVLATRGSQEYAGEPRWVAGLHEPIPIDPTVRITDADTVRHFYRLLLNRFASPNEVASQMRATMAFGRIALFEAIIGSPEANANASNHDKAEYVRRLYDVLLQRDATAQEIGALVETLGDVEGSSAPGWQEAYNAMVQSPEFKQVNCELSYYTYDEPLALGTPVLGDVVDGAAIIPDLGESTPIDDGPLTQDGSRIAFFRDRASGTYFGFSRWASDAPELVQGIRLQIRLYERSGEKTLLPVTGAIFRPEEYSSFAVWNYDPSLVIDHSVCPTRYVMALECDGSACLSYSTTPTVSESWVPIRQIVRGSLDHSASTANLLLDHEAWHLSWTDVERGPDGRTTTVGVGLPQGPYVQPVLQADDFAGQWLLEAEPDPTCDSGWDCNNRDGQYWVNEGAFTYMIYNGANYFDCERDHDNRWGAAVARDVSAQGTYPDRSEPVLADQDTTCDVSYPVVHAEDGRLIVTYANWEVDNDENFTRPGTRWAPLRWE